MLSETQDLDVCCKMIGGILEGMMRSFHNVCPESVSDILSTGINLLNSELLDLRQFLKDVPSNSTVDEILQKHYGLLRTLLGLLYIILEKTDESNRNEGFELKSQALREILLEYYQSIVLFLTRTNSDEVFLCSVTSLCIVFSPANLLSIIPHV